MTLLILPEPEYAVHVLPSMLTVARTLAAAATGTAETGDGQIADGNTAADQGEQCGPGRTARNEVEAAESAVPASGSRYQLCNRCG